MAAGGIGISRRRGSDTGYSSDHFGPYKNVGHCVDGQYISSSARNFHFRRNGGSRTDELTELDKFRAGCDLDRLEEGEIPVCDDGIQPPLEKKRKFSPIIWDVKDKLASKNGVVLTCSNHVTDSVVENFNVSAGLQLVSDKICATEGSSGTTGSESKSRTERTGSHSQEENQEVEEEELIETRNIFLSRWASDSDSPRDAILYDEEDTHGETICRKDIDDGVTSGDRFTSSGSIERDCSVLSFSGDEDSGNELRDKDLMDVDRIEYENDDVNDTDGSCCRDEEPTSQRSVNMLEGCRSVYEYEKLHEINEGTYGKVYKALDKKTGKAVALKKVKMDVGRDRNLEDYGFPLSSLREINILLSLHHPSIVNVKEVVTSGLDGVFMVMEYMEHDLKGFMQAKKQPFSTSEVKCLMLQLLEGVKYLHDNWVLHRDLKTSNLLLNNEGHLKICDFGMSRQYGSPLKPYTSLVITLWYRAPELLLGEKQYSTAVDMWSVGCIMAELLLKEPLFKGKAEIDQLSKIFGILGTPNENIWPGFSKLPGAKAHFVNQPNNLLRQKFPAASFTGTPILSDLGLDLLNKLLTYDPEKRLTADDALNHAWFHEVPLPKSKELMPTLPPQFVKNR